MEVFKPRSRRVGTARRQKDRKALRGQLNDLDIENRLLRKENEQLKQTLQKIELHALMERR